MKRVRVTIDVVENQSVLRILSVYVALVIQYAKSRRHITRTLLSMACRTVPYLSTLSHKRNVFLEKVPEH